MENNFTIKRFDLSTDKSLKAWNAADEYLLSVIKDQGKFTGYLGIYNDRFGYLSCHLSRYKTVTIITNKSQEKAIYSNAEANTLSLPIFVNPIESTAEILELAIVKTPKSLDLFRLFLEHISNNSNQNVKVLCGFMTRHFSPKLLEIASEYFESVEQSKAVKKARLLTLSKKKTPPKAELISSIGFEGNAYKQYLGVFSANHIDYATQFFLEHLQVSKNDKTILDLASGNGIIGGEINKLYPSAEIHLMDDSYLAVSSAKFNIRGNNIHHYFNNDLSDFESNCFDLIVTNPPFHFEYEINIQVPLVLFNQCYRCLKQAGNLQIVANKHLNYKLHLDSIFTRVDILAENKKFVVYKCSK